jgi:hypothetical protein
MFLKIFRSQQPANFLIIPLIAGLLWLPSVFRTPILHSANDDMPVYHLIVSFLPAGAAAFLALMLVILQALYLNYLINKYEVLYKPSFLPALIYVLLMSFSREVMWLHPVVLVNMLVLALFDRAFALFKHPSPARMLFQGSFFTGLAFLLYYPAIIFYLLLLLSLGIIRSLSLREWLVTLISFLLPIYFACIWAYWRGDLQQFMNYVTPHLPRFRELPHPHLAPALAYETIVVCVLGLLSLFRLRRNFYKNTIRTRSNQRIFVYALFASAISLLLVPAISPYHFTLFALPMAVFIAYYFLSFKSRLWISEVFFVLLVLTVVWNQF